MKKFFDLHRRRASYYNHLGFSVGKRNREMKEEKDVWENKKIGTESEHRLETFLSKVS